MNEEDLQKLSKEELINIVVDMSLSRPVYLPQHNKIEVVDFTVESSESLQNCKETMNELISKHKNFCTLRKAKLHQDKINTMVG